MITDGITPMMSAMETIPTLWCFKLWEAVIVLHVLITMNHGA